MSHRRRGTARTPIAPTASANAKMLARMWPGARRNWCRIPDISVLLLLGERTRSRPSIIATTRSASFASARSWVMKTIVVPWWASPVSSSNTACRWPGRGCRSACRRPATPARGPSLVRYRRAAVRRRSSVRAACVPARRGRPARAIAGPRTTFPSADPIGAELDREFDVLERGERRQQVEVLEHDPDVLTTPAGEAVGPHRVDPGTPDDQ